MHRATHSVLFALAFAACVQPEQGINRASLDGTVLVEPTSAAEKGKNELIRDAQAVEMPVFGLHWVEASVDTFGADPDTGDITTGDIDWYEVVFTGSTYEAPLAFWFSSPETSAETEADPVFRLEIRELTVDEEDNESWVSVSVEDFEIGGPDPVEVPVDYEFVDDGSYRIALSGVSGGAAAPYRFVTRGTHPDDAGILVGAYATEDPRRRLPLGGAELRPFVLDDETWVYTGEYTMNLFRSTTTVDNPLPALVGPGHTELLGIDALSSSTTVVEEVSEVYVFAGNWPSLTGALPAGTWYSDPPVHVTLNSEHPEELINEDGELSPFVANTADPLLLNAFAPLLIGWEIDEIEPNDAAVNDANQVDLSDPSALQDLGMLSGPGFVDIIHGTSQFVSAEEGWIHDSDAFKLEVPEALALAFTLEWDGDEDLDIMVHDAAGDTIDYGWYGHPEVPEIGPEVLEPGNVYYITVLGWSGDADSNPTWRLLLEQIGQ